mmetsp:Transcript_69374/g.160737  ORF Transcript_69374/g.160737 Transcript_69374/m.160737 type:complete len:206 (+) Transcript_69374:1966-2583(+)
MATDSTPVRQTGSGRKRYPPSVPSLKISTFGETTQPVVGTCCGGKPAVHSLGDVSAAALTAANEQKSVDTLHHASSSAWRPPVEHPPPTLYAEAALTAATLRPCATSACTVSMTVARGGNRKPKSADATNRVGAPPATFVAGLPLVGSTVLVQLPLTMACTLLRARLLAGRGESLQLLYAARCVSKKVCMRQSLASASLSCRTQE